MADKPELESLYREAQSALKAREYDRAVGLLTQILVIDENYKDVSRLLAQTVKLKRRRWYNHPATWGTLGFLLLVGLGFFIAPKISSFYAAQPPAQVVTATTTPSPIPSAIATATLLPTPTPIPLTWKRNAIGLEFPRDTVTAFATDKKDSDVIYASMENAGVYKTIDGGLSWRPAHNGLSNTQVESLQIDSQNPRILYAGTMDGIFKTEDGGENWRRIGEGIYLLMDYQDNSHLYARDTNGIYESSDQGNNWTMTHPLDKDCPSTILSWAIHPTEGDTLFVGGGEGCELGLYQSGDGGRNWALIEMKGKPNIDPRGIGLDKPGNYSAIDKVVIGLDEQGGISIYVHYYIDFDSRQLRYVGRVVSHDGGTTWHETDISCDVLRSGPDNPSTIFCADVHGPRPMTTTAAHIDHPNNAERIIVGGVKFANYLDNGIFISTDGGISWAKRNGGLGSARAELRLDPTNNATMYLAAYYPAPDWAGDIPNCTLYRSLDNGIEWSTIKRNADWCGPTFDAANVLYLNEDGKLQKSGNGGETWSWDMLDPKWMPYNPSTRITFDRTLVFALSSRNKGGSQNVSANPYFEGFVYDAGNVLFYYSTDAGASWQPSTGSEGLSDARLFYTDQSKMIYAIGRIHQSYSTDNGVTWQNCGQDVTTSRSDTRLALDLQGSRLYLATPGQGVLISTDNCGSWQPSNNGLTNLFVNTLAIDPNDANKIYAGTDGGAYISYDSGATWGQVNEGLLGATVVYSIAVDKDGNVYAATPYGVFKLEGK
jgi:photosystem II stability/assembly factor-like uncharacterized protein